MNAIQLKILRRCADAPQWVTGFRNVRQVVRGLVQQGFLISKTVPTGGLQYHITQRGRAAIEGK